VRRLESEGRRPSAYLPLHLENPAQPPDRTTATVRIVVIGRVQGVGFRDALITTAARHRLDGWVRNRSDGSVEAVLRGAPAACEALVAWARRGPPIAIVENVEVRAASTAEAADLDRAGPGFQCRPTG
jgi:acylphosphatase